MKLSKKGFHTFWLINIHDLWLLISSLLQSYAKTQNSNSWICNRVIYILEQCITTNMYIDYINYYNILLIFMT